MLHDDLAAGRLADRDTVCISVVGAGPERGAFVLPLRSQRSFAPARRIGPTTSQRRSSWSRVGRALMNRPLACCHERFVAA
jgi:hypothetical protein